MAVLSTLAKMQKERAEQKQHAEKLNYTPLAIIATSKKPETLTEAVTRILASSMNAEEFERIRGIEYDYTDDEASNGDDFDDFDTIEMDEDAGYFADNQKKGEVNGTKRKNNTVSNNDSQRDNIHQSIDTTSATINEPVGNDGE